MRGDGVERGIGVVVVVAAEVEIGLSDLVLDLLRGAARRLGKGERARDYRGGLLLRAAWCIRALWPDWIHLCHACRPPRRPTRLCDCHALGRHTLTGGVGLSLQVWR